MFPNIDDQIFELFKEIESHKQMMSLSKCPHIREYHKENLLSTIETVSTFIIVQKKVYRAYEDSYLQRVEEQLHYEDRQRKVTLEELAQYDGSDGKPAYVAVNDTVYDVSNNPVWRGGNHYGLIAGKELTAAFEGCHGVKEILNKLPIVGTLVRV
jgi:predicted heme/steroid binding protein